MRLESVIRQSLIDSLIGQLFGNHKQVGSGKTSAGAEESDLNPFIRVPVDKNKQKTVLDKTASNMNKAFLPSQPTPLTKNYSINCKNSLFRFKRQTEGGTRWSNKLKRMKYGSFKINLVNMNE